MQKKQQSKNKANKEKPRTSVTERKIRRQQIGMVIVGAILILAMVLALAMNY